MSDGQNAAEPLLPQDQNLVIAGITTTPEARAAAKALLLEGLVTDAQRIIDALNSSAATLTQSVSNLVKLHAFLALSPLTELANKVERLETRLRARIVQVGNAAENAIVGAISTAEEAANDALGVPTPPPTVNVDLPSVPPVDIMDTPDPGPLGGPDEFVSAHRSAPKTVIYVDASGRETVRESGSRAWRNNNPGKHPTRQFYPSQRRDR
jgi:hypothetical protein